MKRKFYTNWLKNSRHILLLLFGLFLINSLNLSAQNLQQDSQDLRVVVCDCHIACPVDITVNCDEGTDPDLTGWATIQGDDCPPDYDVDYTDDANLDLCGLGTIIRTWTVTFECDGSQTETCQQIITIIDETPPDITCPTDITFDCTMGDAGTATATDNCDPDPSIGFSDVAYLDNCGLGTVERTWTATDCAGNSASCLQIITIQDVDAPDITCPADVTFDCAMGDAGTATATDNCDPDPSIGFSDVEYLDDCGLGTVERTWTATDCAGNSASCLQIITIQDVDPPVITCPADITFQDCEMGDTGLATATDNCDPDPGISYTDVSDGGTNPEVITRTWTATDCAGLTAECDQTITIYCEQGGGCTYTQGYWKTHSIYGPAPYDDTWAEIGEDTPFYYSSQTYYEVLWTPPRGGNAYYILAHQFIAAKLNFLNGADPSDTQAAFDEAEVLFDNPVHTPAYVKKLKKTDPDFRQYWIDLAEILDDYNNGDIGPGHCEDEEEGDRTAGYTMEDINNVQLLAFPNPFTSSVTIEFMLPHDSDAVLEIYNMNGILVTTLFDGEANAHQNYSFEFKGTTHLKQETYMYILRAGETVKRGRLVMIR